MSLTDLNSVVNSNFILEFEKLISLTNVAASKLKKIDGAVV
jgi:hypothetical protein